MAIMKVTIMKTPKKISQQPLLTFLLAIISCAITAIYFKWEQTGKFFVPETILVFAVMFVAGFIMMVLAWRMMKYFSNKSSQQLVKQMIPAIILFYVAWYIVSNTVISIGDFIWFLIQGLDLSGFISYLLNVEKVFVKPELPDFLLIFTIIFFYILWRQSILREQKLREENLIFQNQTLKDQINPHFLFNSLNTLSSLVTTQTEIAELFINRLSSIYRYILENSPKDKIPLQSELTFINDYFYLYKIRDEDKIQLTIDIKDADKFEILPVSLQLLIENAIKHNMATRENPLIIIIYLEDQYVVVKNNLQKMATQLKSTKTGLKNLGERIRLMTGKELVIEETKTDYLVKVPLI
ncbi:MAG: histidine kinase [Ignavibacteriales bacterium]|nr:histidine kinase [Ignavibacteriales bacterium]